MERVSKEQLACEQALCLGKKIAKACSQAKEQYFINSNNESVPSRLHGAIKTTVVFKELV